MTPNIDIENEKVNEHEDEEDEEDEEMTEHEDEEMSEYEDEEMSEHDIELEGGYERVMTEVNESDEENDGEETSEEDLDEEVIIDQPLNREQMPQSFGEFAPYFKNITESLLFCWMQKHRICKL